MLKRGAIHNGADLQQSGSGTGMQHSSTDPADLNPPPIKRIRTEEDEATSNDEAEDTNTSQGPLVPISKAAATFLETTFSTKLDNNAHKARAKANGTPDSCWIQCAKLDPVVSANVLEPVWTADRASSQI